jgi:hypothetical protein
MPCSQRERTPCARKCATTQAPIATKTAPKNSASSQGLPATSRPQAIRAAESMGNCGARAVQQAGEARDDDAHEEHHHQPAHHQQHHGVDRRAYELVLERLHFPLVGRIAGQALAEVAGALAGLDRGDQQFGERARQLHGGRQVAAFRHRARHLLDELAPRAGGLLAARGSASASVTLRPASISAAKSCEKEAVSRP